MKKKHLNKILSIKLFRILGDVNIGVVYSPHKTLRYKVLHVRGFTF